LWKRRRGDAVEIPGIGVVHHVVDIGGGDDGAGFHGLEQEIAVAAAAVVNPTILNNTALLPNTGLAVFPGYITKNINFIMIQTILNGKKSIG
jgi:hypothetical protein